MEEILDKHSLVVKHGDRTKILEASIKFHPICEMFKILILKSKICSFDLSFIERLFRIGNGEHDKTDGLPEEKMAVTSHI